MTRDFTYSQLSELRRISQFMFHTFQSALEKRTFLISDCLKSEEEYNICLKDRYLNPDLYYICRFFDKQISIVRENVNDKIFHFKIHCVGFHLQKIGKDKITYYTNSCKVGDYDSLDVAIDKFGEYTRQFISCLTGVLF